MESSVLELLTPFSFSFSIASLPSCNTHPVYPISIFLGQHISKVFPALIPEGSQDSAQASLNPVTQDPGNTEHEPWNLPQVAVFLPSWPAGVDSDSHTDRGTHRHRGTQTQIPPDSQQQIHGEGLHTQRHSPQGAVEGELGVSSFCSCTRNPLVTRGHPAA